jgi:hypothetical protein
MTLHQLIPTRPPVNDRSRVLRLKALSCEERSRESSDPTSKQDWADLAIEWHTMAHLAARLTGELEDFS